MRAALPRYLLPLLLLAAAASAEAGDGPWTLFAGAEHGWFGDDEGSLGDGAGALAGFEYRVSRRISIQGQVSHSRHAREFDYSVVRFSGHETLVGASFVYRFPGRSVSPYLMAGLGLLSSQRESHFEPDVFRHDDVSRTWQLGAGLDIPVHGSLALRPEVRLLQSSNYLRRFGASLSLAFHF